MSSAPILLGGVLAGGLSRRMDGVDKSLMRLGGSSLIERAVSRLVPQVSHIAINANGDTDRFDNFKLDIVHDIIDGFAGPLAGIHTLMDYAVRNDTEFTHVITVAADTPFYPVNFVKTLASANASSKIVIAKSGGFKHPVFGLWSIDLYEALTQFLLAGETRKVMAFVTEQVYSFAEFDFYKHPGGLLDPFFNVNCPDDLTMADKHLNEWNDDVR